jgi:hypothetical protein
VLGVGLAALFLTLPSCGGGAKGSQSECTTPTAGQAAAKALTGNCPAVASDYDAKIVITCPVPSSGGYVETFTGKFTPNPNLPGYWGGTFTEVAMTNGQSIGPFPVPLTMSINNDGTTQRFLVQASHLISPVYVPIAGGTGAGTESNCPTGAGSVTAKVTPVTP